MATRGSMPNAAAVSALHAAIDARSLLLGLTFTAQSPYTSTYRQGQVLRQCVDMLVYSTACTSTLTKKTQHMAALCMGNAACQTSRSRTCTIAANTLWLLSHRKCKHPANIALKCNTAMLFNQGATAQFGMRPMNLCSWALLQPVCT